MPVYRTRGLPDGTLEDREFVFIVDEVSGRLRIPGEHRGPDVTIADSLEQERWLDAHPDLLVRYWDCEWSFVDAGARQRLVAMLSR